jgi:predicted phosphodiesterase
MRVLAVSDLHVDYEANAQWVRGLSRADYVNDVLLLCGDISDSEATLRWCFDEFVQRFKSVMFVPGNHELWVVRDAVQRTSLEKFDRVRRLALEHGIKTERQAIGDVELVPLLSWYDFSFGSPSEELLDIWSDFRTCRWPQNWDAVSVTRYFLDANEPVRRGAASTVISFSHFLPRIDVMPDYIPHGKRIVYPVLGTQLLDQQIRRTGAQMHVYGHSHVNRNVQIDGIVYVNNAFGYPSEGRISRKALITVYCD